MPTGQSEHRDEVQFRISIPDAIDGKPTTGAWNPANDWSYEGVEDAPMKLELEAAFNDHITMYVDDVLVWGTEPDGTTPDLSQPATKPENPTSPTTEKPTGDSKNLLGDANEDGDVNMADVAAIIQHIGNQDEYGLSAQGIANAELCDNKEGIMGMDAMAIQLLLAKQITSLPYVE